MGLLIAWAASIVLVCRRGWWDIARLDAAVGVAVAVSALSISRAFGVVVLYLFRWVLGLTALMIVATLWPVVRELWARYATADDRLRWSWAADPAELAKRVTVGGVVVLVPVPYTHLTPPTGDLVEVPGVAVSLKKKKKRQEREEHT